jgi:hypothetical protein
MSKFKLHLIGWLTLILFPLPVVLWQYFFLKKPLLDLLYLQNFKIFPIGLGFSLGATYAMLVLLFLQNPFFENLPFKPQNILKAIRLNYFDAFFLSFCAGFGEEMFFRVGLQLYFSPFIVSLIFIALHGYFSIKYWKNSAYGLLLLPFILLLGYGVDTFGFWFVVSAHFSYNLLLFDAHIRNQLN